MDETKTAWFRWIADNFHTLFWIMWGAIAGAFAIVAIKGSGVLSALDGHNGAITAAFTIVMAVSTIGMWKVTHDLWISSRKQIDVASESALAAKAAVEIASQTAERQLRAYLSLVTPKYRVADAGKSAPAHVLFRVANNGQTPALSARRRCGFAIDSEDACPTPAFGDWDSPFHLAPGRHLDVYIEHEHEKKLTETEKQELGTGKKVVFYFGEIEYTDVFDKTRVTRYCVHTPKVRHLDKDGAQPMSFAKEHNWIT